MAKLQRRKTRILGVLTTLDVPRKLWVSERPDTVWVALPKLHFALGDQTLLASVKKELVEIRKAKGLPHPPPSKGARRRPLSWQPLELLDQKRYLGLVFNDSERNGSSLLSVGARFREARQDTSGTGMSLEWLLLWRKFWKHTHPCLVESGAGILPACLPRPSRQDACSTLVGPII